MKGLALAALLVSTLLAAPLVADAQPTKMHQIGFLSVAHPAPMASRVDAFRQGLRDLGYIEGQNISVAYRWAEGKSERLTGLATELVRLKVSIIVVHGVAAAVATRLATATIPIVCFACGDVVSTKLVASLARPGGNITGVTSIHPEVSGKRLELLKEIVPGLARVAVLFNPGNPVSGPELKETKAAARALRLELNALPVKDPDEFENVFSSLTKGSVDAVIVLSDAMFDGQRQRIADLAATSRLPAVSFSGQFATAGGLMSYGADVFAISRRAASYVDRIFKGAKPADLPIEQPSIFERFINPRTAKALGLTIPPSLLQRADHVIH